MKYYASIRESMSNAFSSKKSCALSFRGWCVLFPLYLFLHFHDTYLGQNSVQQQGLACGCDLYFSFSFAILL